MKKLAVSAIFFAACLWAADFWQSKPFTDWSDKDVKKMLDSSPWSKETNVAIGGGEAPGGNTGKRGSRTPGTMGEANPVDRLAESGLEEPGKPGGRGGGGNSDGATIPTTTLIVRWQSARPVKEALARAKYGSEVGTSPDAKKLIEAVEPNYIIVVSGLMRTLFQPDSASQKKDILGASALAVKGKDPIRPVDFMAKPNGRLVDAYFAFPNTNPFSLEDKEVEFTAKFRAITVRQRFQLKNMVINGKLEL